MNSRLKTVLLAAIAGVICTGGLTAGGDGAKAQSFDCAKASTRVERLICDNPRLDELDSDLAEAYATLGVVGSEKHQNYTAIGPAINFASRLCDAASDGQVLVTQRVCTEVGDAFTFEPVGELELKGVSRAMNVFSLN